MFLFDVRRRLTAIPPPMEEGRFAFHSRSSLNELALPRTDREQIWPLYWRHRGGFFAAHCRCLADGRHEWVLEQGSPAVDGG
jgi:hypothetical protein